MNSINKLANLFAFVVECFQSKEPLDKKQNLCKELYSRHVEEIRSDLYLLKLMKDKSVNLEMIRLFAPIDDDENLMNVYNDSVVDEYRKLTKDEYLKLKKWVNNKPLNKSR